jgi:hypothetical protein
MRNKKAHDESFKAILLAVRKEMAKPTMAASARGEESESSPLREGPAYQSRMPTL